MQRLAIYIELEYMTCAETSYRARDMMNAETSYGARIYILYIRFLCEVHVESHEGCWMVGH